MTLLWFATLIALILAVGAHLRARRLMRRLEQLSHWYWELKYESGQLRAQVARLDPEQQQEAARAEPVSPGRAFVPLSSLKR